MRDRTPLTPALSQRQRRRTFIADTVQPSLNMIYRSTPPVFLLTSATIFAATASIS
jgi:hypothetical protein